MLSANLHILKILFLMNLIAVTIVGLNLKTLVFATCINKSTCLFLTAMRFLLVYFNKYSFIDWLSLTVPIFAYELAIAADAIKNALQRILLS